MRIGGLGDPKLDAEGANPIQRFREFRGLGSALFGLFTVANLPLTVCDTKDLWR